MNAWRNSLLIAALGMLACRTLVPEPTPTAAPTATPRPSPTPRPTVRPPADQEMGLLVAVRGFTMHLPLMFPYENDGDVIFIANQTETATFTFTGDTYYLDRSMDDVLNAFLDGLEHIGWRFTKGETRQIEIGGSNGVWLDLTATVENAELEGAALAGSAGPGFALFGIGLSEIVDGESAWASEGRAQFEELIDTIAFTDMMAECPVSEDDTYGLSPENPIQVGGDYFDGPSRERAYLEHLRGPNGEVLAYERVGSTMGEEVVLDEYEITGEGVDAVLYIDMYVYAEPQAPVGFTCEGAFPLAAP